MRTIAVPTAPPMAVHSDQPPDSHANDAGDKYDEYHDSTGTEV